MILDIMQMTETMISGMVKEISGSYVIHYAADEGGEPVAIDFSPPWRRISMIDGLGESVSIHANIQTHTNLETHACTSPSICRHCRGSHG